MPDTCDATGLPYVSPPTKLDVPRFRDPHLLFIRVVDKINSNNKKQKKVVIVTYRKLILATVEGSFTRFLGCDLVSSLHQRKIPSKSGELWQILLKVPTQFDILLNFTHDNMNDPMDDQKTAEHFVEVMRRLHKEYHGESENFAVEVPSKQDLYQQGNFDKHEGWQSPKNLISKYVSSKNSRSQSPLTFDSSYRSAPSSRTSSPARAFPPGSPSNSDRFDDFARRTSASLSNVPPSPSPRRSSDEKPRIAEERWRNLLDLKGQEWNQEIEGENIQLKMKMQELKQQLLTWEKQNKESVEKENDVKGKLKEEIGSRQKLQEELRDVKERLHVAEEVAEEKDRLLEEEKEKEKEREKARRLEGDLVTVTPAGPTGGSVTPPPPLAPPAVVKEDSEHDSRKSDDNDDSFDDGGNLTTGRRPTEPAVGKRYVLYSPSPSPDPVQPNLTSSYKSLRESSKSGSPLRRISSGSSKMRRCSLQSIPDEETMPLYRVNTVNLPPQGSFCLSTRSNSFASPTVAEGSLEPSFDEKLALEGVSAEERQALAGISIRSVSQLRYATMRDLVAVLPGPAVRKILTCTGYKQGAAADDTLLPVLPEGAGGVRVATERREASIPISLDDGGRGILTENSNLRSMVAYLQSHITYLDALGMGTAGDPPEISFASGLPPASPLKAPSPPPTSLEINEEITDWPAEFGSYEEFLEFPDKKAFVIGEKPKTPTKSRSWGASWGHRTETQAIEEAKRLCLSRSATCTVIFPSQGTMPFTPKTLSERKCALPSLVRSMSPSSPPMRLHSI